MEYRIWRTFIYTLVWTIILFNLGCSDEDSSFNDRKNQVIGVWNAKLTGQHYLADSIFLETTSNADYEFNSDGTGIMTPELTFFEPIEFTWYFQYMPESYILLYPTQGSTLQQSKSFRVLENESDRQVWIDFIYFQNGQMIPGTDSIHYTLTLTRI